MIEGNTELSVAVCSEQTVRYTASEEEILITSWKLVKYLHICFFCTHFQTFTSTSAPFCCISHISPSLLTMDIGGLTTVVANSAYISARGSIDSSVNPASNRDKKYHSRLKLPHITVCEGLRETLDLGFQTVCVEQPIGKRLFQEFLDSKREYKGPCRLWKDIEEYNMAEDEDRVQRASKILSRYMEPDAKYFCPFLPENGITKVKEKHQEAGDDLFGETMDNVMDFLKEVPYTFFLEGMYLKRFLQWKWLEMQPMGEDWFLDFRVLGKGGFGEVSACQMRATGKLYACKKLNKKRLKKRKGNEVRNQTETRP